MSKVIDRIANFIKSEIQQEYKEHVFDLSVAYNSYKDAFDVSFSLEEHIVTAEILDRGKNFLIVLGEEISSRVVMNSHKFVIGINIHFQLNILSPIKSIEIKINL